MGSIHRVLATLLPLLEKRSSRPLQLLRRLLLYPGPEEWEERYVASSVRRLGIHLHAQGKTTPKTLGKAWVRGSRVSALHLRLRTCELLSCAVFPLLRLGIFFLDRGGRGGRLLVGTLRLSSRRGSGRYSRNGSLVSGPVLLSLDVVSPRILGFSTGSFGNVPR